MSTPMTPDREQEIRAREQAATPGPWQREDDQRRLERFVSTEDGVLSINFGYLGNNNQADTEFVADARSAVPELLAEVDRLRARVAELEAGSSSYKSTPLPPGEALCTACGHNGAAHHHAGTACWADIPKRLGEAIRLCPCKAFTGGTS